MSTPSTSPVIERHLLLQLGQRLKQLRKTKGLSGKALAEAAGISRTTLTHVEAGDPGPSMGTYARVMFILGIGADLALLGSDTIRSVSGPRPSRALRSRSAVRLSLKIDGSRHQPEDLQSLALHEAAVRAVRDNPALLDEAKATLHRWLSSGDSRSAELWQAWQDILEKQSWRKVLGRTRQAQQLRQASPLVTVLPEQTREQVLADVKELRAGIVVGDEPT